MIDHFSQETIKTLGYYVYVYSDPETKKPFYIGKGKGNRVFNHLKDQSETDKVKKIKEIKSRGEDPLIEILAYGLDEETALIVESAAIDLIGINNLTNIQKGYESRTFGRIEASVLDKRCRHEKLNPDDIDDNLMLIRINQLYRNDMSDLELYEATRGYWRLSVENAKKVGYVLAVYDGLVVEVYEPSDWLPAGSTYMETRGEEEQDFLEDRYEFVGRIADEDVRDWYNGKNVADLFPNGDANPIRYILKKH